MHYQVTRYLVCPAQHPNRGMSAMLEVSHVQTLREIETHNYPRLIGCSRNRDRLHRSDRHRIDQRRRVRRKKEQVAHRWAPENLEHEVTGIWGELSETRERKTARAGFC